MSSNYGFCVSGIGADAVRYGDLANACPLRFAGDRAEVSVSGGVVHRGREQEAESRKQ